jgi:glycosyltransferase involved in cell wall biosynthesis/8-oxo-dGTP pyrophosphatase MutT (NUDIX family)
MQDFRKYYWSKTCEVIFEPHEEILERLPVTSCMAVVIVDDEYVAISCPERGWGLPGGHVEKGESPEDAIVREVWEETGIKIREEDLRIVGGWHIKNLVTTKSNRKYPTEAYQLLYIVHAHEVCVFDERYEVADRAIVPINRVLRYIKNPNFKPIYKYIVKKFNLKSALTQPLVSFIVPAYNTEEYIDRCLDSIVKQDHENIEIIIVDDGSTDRTSELCAKYERTDQRTRLIKLEKNYGLAHARNVGISFVRGDYISFVDSDDYIAKNFTSRLLNSITDNKIDIVECANNCTSRTGRLLSKDKQPNYHTEKILSTGKQALSRYCMRSSQWKSTSTAVWGKIYSTFLFKNNRIIFYEPLRIYEDSDITYRLYYYARKHLYINDQLYYHRHRIGSVMRPDIKIDTSIYNDIVNQRKLEFFSSKKRYLRYVDCWDERE